MRIVVSMMESNKVRPRCNGYLQIGSEPLNKKLALFNPRFDLVITHLRSITDSAVWLEVACAAL